MPIFSRLSSSMSSKFLHGVAKLFIFMLAILPPALPVEQTLIIDFEKPHSARPRSGDYPPEGIDNTLTIEKGPRVRLGRGDGLPSSIQELKELIRQMDLAFARRFEQLSKRLDRLEANQLHFRHVALADWSAFSVDKRIRVFSNVRSNWPEADQVCRAHGGTLLQIESEQENQRISDFLKAGDNGIYWIGTQTTLRFDISSVAGNYSNFEGNDLHNGNGTDEHLLPEPVHQMCGAISSRNGGRWMNRECLEKHSFICQI